MIAPHYFVGSKKFVHSNDPEAFNFPWIGLHSKIYKLKKFVQKMLSINSACARKCQQIGLQQGFGLQQPLLEHHGDDIFRYTTRQFKPATTSTISMDYILIIGELLCLNTQTALSGRPSTNNIANHIELPAAFGRERKPLGCVGEEPLPGFQRRVRVPVIRLLRASNDSSALKGAWNTEGPRAICILSSNGLRDGITDETGLT